MPLKRKPDFMYRPSFGAGADRNIGLWVETKNGLWTAMDVYRDSLNGLKNLRKGKLLYGKE
jgi:hypothetical protein